MATFGFRKYSSPAPTVPANVLSSACTFTFGLCWSLSSLIE
jgi:hypothetical protein